jgi:hypothetical protein
MKKYVRYALIALVAFLVVAQLIPLNRDNPPVTAEIDAPKEVKDILKRSCYDCHSNQVVYPWYSYVAPVSWLVVHHVNEGRHELNFSTFESYSAKRKQKKLHETWEEISEGKMPMDQYLWMHSDAKLSTKDLAVLKGWLGQKGALEENEGGENGAQNGTQNGAIPQPNASQTNTPSTNVPQVNTPKGREEDEEKEEKEGR